MNRRNIINVAIAFALAVLAWASIRLGGDNQMILQVKVKLIGVPGNLIVTEKMKETVAVTIRGSRAGLSRVQEDTLGIEIDISDRMGGIANLELDSSQVKGLPPGVSAVSINPSLISVKLEALVEEMIPVKENLIGTLPDGYSIKMVEIHPAQIQFRGPAALGKKLKDVMIEPVEARTLIKLPEREVSVISSPEIFAYLSPRKVTLKADLTEEVIVRKLTVPVIPFHREGHAVQTVPSSVTLMVTGPATSARAVSPSSFDVEADFSPYPPGRYRRVSPRMKLSGAGTRNGLEIAYTPKQFDVVVTAK